MLEEEKVERRSPALRDKDGVAAAQRANRNASFHRGRPRRRPARVRGGQRGGFAIFAAFLALSAAVAIAVAVRAHDASDLSYASPYGHAVRAVIFVIDGASAGDLQSPELKSIRALEDEGVRYSDAWLGQVEGVPAASGATIATGSFPRATGVLGNAWMDAKSGQVRYPADPSQVLVGSLDQVMETRPVTPLATLIKTRNPRARVLSVGGESCAGAAAAAAWTADYVACAVREGPRWVATSVVGHDLPAGTLHNDVAPAGRPRDRRFAVRVQGWPLGQQDLWVARQTVAAMRRVHPALTVVTFSELSTLLQFAPPSLRQAVKMRVMEGVDRDIALIEHEMQRERVFRSSVFVITSGRALSPIRSRIRRATLETAVIAAGGVRAYLQSDTATFLGLGTIIQAQPVAQAIQDQRLSGVDAIYYKNRNGSSWSYQLQYPNPDLPARFADSSSYLLSTIATSDSADVVVSYAPGTGTGGTVRGGFEQTTGSLGLQWDDQHIPLIIAGHGVNRGVVSRFPARLVDIAPTIESMLGLTPPRVDGIVLADALIEPPAGAAERLQKRVGTLTRVVQSLRQRMSL